MIHTPIDPTCKHCLDDPHSFWLVKKGYVDVFATPVGCDTSPASVGEYCFRIKTGNIIIGMPPQETHQLKMVLWAVPHRDSEIVKKNIQSLINSNFDLASVKHIDSWLQSLEQAMMSGPFTLPRQYELLEAEPRIHYEKGIPFSAHHGDVIWLEAHESPLFYGGEPTLKIPKGSIHPITHEATLKLEKDSLISSYHTPAMMLRENFRDILYEHQCFFMRVMNFNFLSQADANRKIQKNYRETLLARREHIQHIMTNIPLSKKEFQEEPQSAPEHRQSLIQVGTRIAKEWGINLPQIPQSEFLKVGVSTMQILEQMGFSARKVDLQNWNHRKHIAGHLIGCDKNSREMVGFLPPHGNRKHYIYFNPAKNEERILSEQDVADISFSALYVHPPLTRHIRDIKGFLGYIFTYKRRDIKFMLAITMLNSIFFIFIPLLAGKILTQYIPGHDLTTFALAMVGFCIAGVASLLLYFASSLFYISLNGHFSFHAQTYLWKKIITLPMNFFQQYSVGEILSRMNGVHIASGMLNVSLIQYFSAFISGVVGLLLLFSYNATFTLILLSIIVVLIFVDYFLFRKILSLEEKSHALEFQINDFVLQIIYALSKIRLARREQFALFQWSKKFCFKRVLIYRTHLLRALYQLLHSHFLFYSNIALFMMASSNPQGFPLEYYIVFNMVLTQLSFSINQISAMIYLAIGAIPFLKRIQPVIHAESPSTLQKTHPKTLRGRIQFSQVSFGYRTTRGGRKSVLKDISFTVEPGEYVAIVGASGSGKSTIIKLILGLEHLQSGSIQLDQYNIEELDLQSLREQIGTVLQSTHVLPTNVIKNIAMGAEQEESEIAQVYKQAWQSLDKASLKQEIANMPMGMHTFLTEAGEDISGGERQRLLVARALNKNPRILIFDEATSAMDNITQNRIKKILDGLNITRIVVAHRLSTITNVHRIIMLKEGRIVEQGSYQGLMQKGGEFAKFARRQIF